MEVSTSESSQSTFRDPAGSLQIKPEGVLRTVYSPHDSEILAFLSTPLAARLVEQRQIVASEVVNPGRGSEPLVLRHPRIAFISYPAEWPPSLWLAAAELTLGLCTKLLKEGWILKDATPLNVLFQGTQPIFVDILSIQKADLSRPIWYAYAQFVRTFLLPMLAYSQLGWPLHSVLSRRDGFEPEEIYLALPWTRRFRRPALTSVTLPNLLAKRSSVVADGMAPKTLSDPSLTKQIIGNTLSGLLTAMRKATPSRQSSRWSGYAENAVHYNAKDHSDKQQFIASVFAQHRPARVLDIGCNTGTYSRLAADTGAAVVSIDTDLQAVDRFCAELQGTGRNILPLCIDIAHPTPATGWQNHEHSAFLQRAKGQFDSILMLAVLHHLLIGSQIPLDLVASLCQEITTDHLIIEWVPPADPKFVEILRGRDELYKHLSEGAFRHAFARYFVTAQELALRNGRILLHLRKR